ncbi:MAG: hypothetical protein GY715_20185 [Planctomycetes bacterium]|nr:hypothetical protein [Planctomycetota bacterium]
MRSLTASRRLLVGLAGAAAVALTAAAGAQFGQAAGFGDMMTPYFLRRDLQIFAEGLELDDGQAVILESLYWDYEDEHESGKTRMLDRLQSMRDQMQDMERTEILELVFSPFEERSVEWELMRTTFLENVRAILSTEQSERWEEFRRKLRREKELPKGRLSGESINLFHVLHALDLDRTIIQVVQPVLDDYDLALDDAIHRRERLMHESRLAMMHSIRDDQPDAAVSIYLKQIRARIGLRNTNDEYREILVAQLPYEVGPEFEREVLQRAYPRVYRPTAAQRLFAEARKLEGLSPEMLQAIVDLETAYTAELGTVNARLLNLVRDFEPEEAQYRANSFAARSGDARPPRPQDPSRAEFKNRDELGRRYADQLRNLLTPDEFAKLNGSRRFLRRMRQERGDASEALNHAGSSTPGRKSKKRSRGGDGTGGPTTGGR